MVYFNLLTIKCILEQFSVIGFDGVHHEILLANLLFCEFRGVSEEWFRSHLVRRRHRVQEKTLYTAQFIFSDWGTKKYEFSSPYINSRPSIVHNIYKRPSRDNKFCTRTGSVC